MIIKHYELFLPVYKQGDDLAGCLQHTNGDSAAAFLLQAESYTEAARICRLMAGRCKEEPEIQIDSADTHHIAITGPEELCDLLVKDNILHGSTFVDDDVDDDEDECGPHCDHGEDVDETEVVDTEESI